MQLASSVIEVNESMTLQLTQWKKKPSFIAKGFPFVYIENISVSEIYEALVGTDELTK